MTDSQQLLAEYVHSGSEAAFRGLVTRYVDLVYTAALRLVEGDTHRAEDVAQTVFADLARMARTLSNDVMLGGWLHRHTCFVAANTMRGERRRQSRERQAVEMNALQDHADANLSLVAPILDQAINELGEADRAAILLRFFEQWDFRSVGEVLGSGEDAARMRVTRALEKLETLLKRHGVTSTATALSLLLSTNAVQAAPVGLAVTISTAAALAGATIVTTATTTATKVIAMTTLQKTLITATIAAAVGTGIYEARQASRLRGEVQTLQQQQGPLAAQVQQLNKSLSAATSQTAGLRNDNERLNHNTAELLKLRGEATRLRDASQELAQLKGNPRPEKTFSTRRVGPLRLQVDNDQKQGELLDKLSAGMEKRLEQQASNMVATLKASLNLTSEQEQNIRGVLLQWTALSQANPTEFRNFSGADLLEMNVLPMEMNLIISDMNADQAAQNREAVAKTEEQIKALLSPDQQSAYEQYKKDEAIARARHLANDEALGMQEHLGLTQEQQDKASSALYDFWIKVPEMSRSTENDNPSKWFLEQHLKAIDGILSPAQLDQYRRLATESGK
jgi:RNA polymerase sigma factor (sigma-70 family)